MWRHLFDHSLLTSCDVTCVGCDICARFRNRSESNVFIANNKVMNFCNYSNFRDIILIKSGI